jgi:hypothetical protein
MHTNCQRCGRPLTSPTSQRNGYGKTCGKHIRTAATNATTYKHHQIEAALELIGDGAILPIRPGRVWATVSTDGQSTHRTAHNACSCPAGISGKLCYHRAAVAILTA